MDDLNSVCFMRIFHNYVLPKRLTCKRHGSNINNPHRKVSGRMASSFYGQSSIFFVEFVELPFLVPVQLCGALLFWSFCDILLVLSLKILKHFPFISEQYT